jgi:hypothetical protein
MWGRDLCLCANRGGEDNWQHYQREFSEQQWRRDLWHKCRLLGNTGLGEVTDLDIISVELKLLYDSAILTATGAAGTGTIAESWGDPVYNTATPGEIIIVMASSNPLSGSGTLVNVDFDVADSAILGGTGLLTFSEAKFNGGAVPAQVQDGIFTVRGIYGDISGNGTVSAYDAAFALQHAAGLYTLLPEQLIPGDVDGDGDVDAYDAALILQYIVEIIDCFPVEPGCDGQSAPGVAGQIPTIKQILAVEVSLPELTGQAGGSITIPINISDTSGEEIIGVEIILTYDPDILTATGAVTEGTLMSGWKMEHKVTNGQISIAMAHSEALSGDGVLIQVEFSVSGSASPGHISPLTLQRVLLNEDSPGTVTHGSITISEEQQVELYLHQAWNLISLSVNPADNALQSVLESVWGNVNSVWTYDSNPGWRRYVAAGPDFLNTLITMESGRGYWINTKDAATLTVTGSQIDDTAVELFLGWNLVGYSYQVIRDRATALASISEECASIWTYDSATQQWLRYVEGTPDFLNTLTQLEPGRGYWINVTEDCVWSMSP